MESLNYPLSDLEIKHFFNGDVNIIKYRDLKDEFPERPCIILFESRPTNHWVLVMDLDDGSLLYHDSYGCYPSDEFNWIPKSIQKLTKQNQKKMYEILLKYPKVRYNQYCIQDKGTSTCGKHCCIRALFPSIDENDYFDLISGYDVSPDEIVNLIFNKLYS